MNTNTKQNKKEDFAYFYLLLYVFWGFVFTKTVFANNLLVYVSFLFLLVAFFIKSVRYGVRNDNLVLIGMPFIVYTALSYFVYGDFEQMSYWFVALMIIMTGATSNITNRLSFKLLYFFGLVAFIGIMVQFLFPNYYNAFISPLFVKNYNENWAENYGFSGFTYQLATTAEILVCAECVVLFMWEKISAHNRQWVKWIVIVALVIGVFMTGKRTNTIIALVLPFFVNYMSQKNTKGRFRWLFLFIVLLSLLFGYIYNNLAALGESVVFKRTVFSFNNIGNEIVTSNRAILWDRAMSVFHRHPIFGIGVGRFRSFTRTTTDVHNMYLQCLCEQGVFGITLFVVMIVIYLKKTIKTIRHSIDPQVIALLSFSLAIQLVYVIEGITENMNVNLSGFLLYSIGVAIMLDCDSRNNNKEAVNAKMNV